jgi:isocitrate/isopropylmalate dehydrogenase
MNKVNPIATIQAARLMLDHLGERDKAERIERAIARIVAEGKVRTYDMGGTTTTSGMADAVISVLD